jgi:hypothetical protein
VDASTGPLDIFYLYFSVFLIDFEVRVAAVEVTQNCDADLFCSQEKHPSVVLSPRALKGHHDVNPILFLLGDSRAEHICSTLVMVH